MSDSQTPREGAEVSLATKAAADALALLFRKAAISGAHKVYVVEGQTGEYSDQHCWLVRAFLSEQRAQQFVTACSVIGRETLRQRAEWCEKHQHMPRDGSYPKSGLDPNFSTIGDNFEYTYYEVELEIE